MRKIIILVITFITILFIFLMYNAIFVHNDKIKIEAASAFYPFTSNLMQNIYGQEDMVKLVSTSQAYSDIIKRKTDIIISTAPSEEQKEMIQKSNVSLEYKTLYYEPLVIFLNKNNIIDNLSIEQIQDIYYHNNSNWNTYQLEKNNGSQTCFESIVKNNELGKNHYEINTMPKIIDKVALDKKGIGYAFYSYYSKMHINDNSKIINVNGKAPSDKDYPLLFEVYLIYRIDNKNQHISKIVNWLETEEYQKFVEKLNKE